MAQQAQFPGVDRTDRQLALLLAAVALALYLRTLAPDVLPGDPGEFQVAAWRLGLAHPTGYPLYLLLGSLWQHLLAWLGVSPAAALNGLSAVLGAAAVGLLYLVVVRWMVGPPAVRRLAAVYSAVLLAVNLTFWSQSLIAEVYTLHTCLVLGLILAAQAITLGMPGMPPTPVRSTPLVLLAALAGLALTHHGMTLLLFPALAGYLGTAARGWRRLPWTTWPAAALAFALPLLLYLYIPLRSGPEASPWYHQRLGGDTLTLYRPTWEGFVTFLTGRSIAVGFHSLPDAAVQLPQAAWLWRYHFGWVGLLMMALGLFWLFRHRAWPILVLTVAYALLQQIFVLFYAIGDILVYYIPLYLIGAIWAGFGFFGLVTGGWQVLSAAAPATEEPQAEPTEPEHTPAAQRPGGVAVAGWLIAGVLLLWTLRNVTATAAAIDQSESQGARTQWESILAAQPPDNAILVSNDRNEIVPLFYLQGVEGRGQGLTGLFPLIAPEPRFADIGATLDTALAAGDEQPVYLIKEMPGLEVKFDLTPVEPPLVRVEPRKPAAPEHAVEERLGPLLLLGYDHEQTAAGLVVRLHWRVEESLAADYTATVQLLDASGEKMAQDDHPAGGIFYPTSHWKPGESLVEQHVLPLPAGLPEPATLLVGMYHSPDLTPLASPLQIPLDP